MLTVFRRWLDVFSERSEMVLAVFVLLALCTDYAHSASGHWSYDDNHGIGPANWADDCSKQSQSPIDIKTNQVMYDTSLKAPVLSSEFGQPVGNVNVKNNGHSVSLSLNTGMQTSGANLPGTFKAVGVHFHWGIDSSTGSEHTVNGKHYPMEMHIVHLNSKYNTVGDGLENSDGLAVLGFFFEEGTANSNFDQLINSFQSIRFKDNATTISGFALGDMMNNNLDGYYRYSGSLTTPPCSEVVTWTVFDKPIQLSATQLNAFRNTIQLPEGMSNNWRPVQPLNGRKVMVSQESLAGTGNNMHGSCLLFIMTVAIGYSLL